MAVQSQVNGSVEKGFEKVRDAFAANFERHGEVGAACCVYLKGERVVDLCGGTTTTAGGQPYTADTLQVVASTGKGVESIAAHILAQEGKLDFDAPVTDYWPEFGRGENHDMPVRWLFSHRAGLSAVDQPLTLDEVYAWSPVVRALEIQRPYWKPGSAHGYHVGTFGWLTGEIIRRISGTTVGRFVAERITEPLNLEFWIGLPAEQHHRVAPMIAPLPPQGPPDVFLSRMLDPSTLLHKAFINPRVLPSDFNTPAFLSAEIPNANGVGTARALAKLYAATIGPVDGIRLLQPDTLERAIAVQSAGEDLVLGYESRYGTGFQLSFPYRPFAGEGSFGHYGMGGSVAFAHPGHGFAFAYVMNQMGQSGGVDPRTKALIDAVVESL